MFCHIPLAGVMSSDGWLDETAKQQSGAFLHALAAA